MKLYYHPVSNTSRPILLFAADHDLDLVLQVVDLFKGEHVQPSYAAINPNCLVPLLEDGDFRLTECSAILKYLADKIESPAYPKELRQRARVNERMDWFNTQFYRDWGYGLIYPQLFPNLKRPSDEQQNGVVAWGKDRSKGWLKILDQNLIGPRSDYLCGSQITLADYLGAAYITAGDVVRCDLSAYPNVTRWIGNMKRRKNWEKVNKPFYDLAASVKEMQFQAV
jgi:glutathione S-transferase